MEHATVEQVKKTIGAEYFSTLRSSRSLNHDGQLVEWIDVVHRGLPKGPSVDVMSRIIEIFWEALVGTDVVPVVNFIDVAEDDRLEAAE